MHAKALFQTGTVVAGLLNIASAAQPTSLPGAVGFVKVTVPVGFSLIANPLDAEDNSIAALFPNVPDGVTIYKFGGSPPEYSVNTYENGWAQPGQLLKPGEGAFFLNPGPDPLVITFYGEVPQGLLSNAIPEGFSLKSSMAPVAGPLDTALSFPLEDGDTVYRFRRAPNPSGYSVHTFECGAWNTMPYIEVGEAFFVKKVTPTVWVKTFSLSQ